MKQQVRLNVLIELKRCRLDAIYKKKKKKKSSHQTCERLMLWSSVLLFCQKPVTIIKCLFHHGKETIALISEE